MHLVIFTLNLDSSTFLPLFTAAIFIPLVRELSLLTQLHVCSWAGPEFNPATWHQNTDSTCRFHKHFNIILDLELGSMLITRHTINSIHFKRSLLLISDPVFFFFYISRVVATFIFTNSDWKGVFNLLKHPTASFSLARQTHGRAPQSRLGQPQHLKPCL